MPIIANGVAVGRVVASVTHNPERLQRDPDLAGRLLALSGQAATAIGNARLLERIRHQALHDALTGLPNRVLILDRVDSMLARARRHHLPAAALFIDLDGFKDINDTLGHGAGDQLLQAVAVRLATVLRDSDSIGRLGGDEFVVLVEGASLDAGPELVAERVLDVLREPFEIEGYHDTPITVTASIGIAVGDRDSAGELLRDADIALYRAKADGKNRFVVFASEMRDAVTERMKLDMDLRGALDRGEFFLVYQPVFELSGGRMIGAEALIRWHHPLRGVVDPDVFVPILEESGHIVQVGRWVLTEACRQAGALARARPPDRPRGELLGPPARNRPSSSPTSAQALLESGIDPSSLILEITETAIMRDAEATARRLRAVKELGVRIAIDDFGTGYSSLAYLSQFPIDSLKIDRSFIATIGDSSEGSALTRMLIELGKALGLETLAEGIEDQSQYAQLQAAALRQRSGLPHGEAARRRCARRVPRRPGCRAGLVGRADSTLTRDTVGVRPVPPSSHRQVFVRPKPSSAVAGTRLRGFPARATLPAMTGARDPIPPTIEWRHGRVRLVDQRVLPHRLGFVECASVDELSVRSDRSRCAARPRSARRARTASRWRRRRSPPQRGARRGWLASRAPADRGEPLVGSRTRPCRVHGRRAPKPRSRKRSASPTLTLPEPRAGRVRRRPDR